MSATSPRSRPRPVETSRRCVQTSSKSAGELARAEWAPTRRIRIARLKQVRHMRSVLRHLPTLHCAANAQARRGVA
jgi:hypothetical protein